MGYFIFLTIILFYFQYIALAPYGHDHGLPDILPDTWSILISFKFEQLTNALEDIDVTVFGIVILLKLVQY